MLFKRNCLVLLVILVVYLRHAECRRRRYKDCPEERLKIRESVADVVVIGTVKRSYSGQGDLYSGEVQVKRAVKGDHIKVGEFLVVEGFGNAEICSSKAIVKDSKIFLLSQLQTGRFRLNSSLLHVNAPNLDKITASVKGVPYKRRPAILDEPCEKKYCAFNGDCYEENRRPFCRCPANCREHYNPICASDGLTYNSECQMRVDSCRKKRSIYVRHESLCSQSE